MRKKNLFIVSILVLLLAFPLYGCGDNEGTADKEPLDYPTIEELEISAKEDIQEGERKVLFSYTNNSEYTVIYLETTMKFKDDVTKEDVNEIYEEVYGDDWKEVEKNGYELGNYAIKLKNQNRIEPGKSSPKSEFSTGWYTVKDMAQYDLVEGDIATIKYIGEDEKIYTVYYDFASNEYSKESEEGEEQNAWSNSELAKQAPKPEFDFEITSDTNSFLRIESYDVTEEELLDYVNECKELGFTKDQFEYGGSYRGTNKDGYKVNISDRTDVGPKATIIDFTVDKK